MPTDPVEAIVFGVDAPWLAARTLRALERLGVDARVQRAPDVRRPVWLLRAGSVPHEVPRAPPPSATGRPLVAFGATRGDAAWTALVARTGGDVEGAVLPRVDSVLVDRPDLLLRMLAEGVTTTCSSLVARATVRAVRLAALDVTFDPLPRVVEAVTTLHRGGAERVVLDLVRELRALGHEVVPVVLDRSSRATFDAPEGTVHLPDLARSRAARIDALGDLAIERGIDLVHVHLADGDEVRHLSRAGVPVVITVHNARDGWPARLEPIEPGDAALVVGCSLDVADELRGARVAAPVRTIWNGIVPGRVTTRARGDELVLLAVANHRPQKRLDRVPGIVAELRSRSREARAILVGEPVRADPEALAIEGAVTAEAKRLGVEDRVELAGSREAPPYADADVVVSTSAFEGLSLVHLEALAAGVPLVTTAVSGTRELAQKHPHASVVAKDADSVAFADAILATGERGGLAPDFTAKAMAARHAELFARALAPRRSGGGVLLVTNNLSTGGAQSSARRLLVALAETGVTVQAAVLEEQREWPTPGREALVRAGVPVHVAPRAGDVDPNVTARDVAALVDRVGPDAVLFWNTIPEHKVLIADMLLGGRVWDVSPGEMYYASFERYFARPRVGLPYLGMRDYGRLLAGAVVKYEAERARAEEALGVPVEVIPNGVTIPERVHRRTPQREVVVGTLSRISPDKKLEQLVDAAKHGGFTLHVAGGVEKGAEAYADALRVRAEGARITFVGEQDSAAFLRTIDLFAMVSEPSGCPNASLEAMAAGLPVVATLAGGVRDQIEPGVTGLVTPRGDAKVLGDAIRDLAGDIARREAMGDAGHARARERFSVARMAAAYAQLLGLSSFARAAE